MTVSLILIPLAIAKPGELKNNDKWQTFEFRIIGSGVPGKVWQTPPEPADPKTIHGRGNEWLIENMVSLTVTIDETEVYTLTSDPINLGYYAVLDYNNIVNKLWTVKLKETIRFMDGETELGTIEMQVCDIVPGAAFPDMTGTFVGIGTGALQGVKVIGTDSFDAGAIVRTGTVMNWPGFV